MVRIFEGRNVLSVFIDDTATSDVYLSLLSDEFVPFLMGYGISMNLAWCQQGGARPHTSNAVLGFLHDVFEERVLSNRYPVLFEEEHS
jgi:hypothetical protein